jgi:hypothetical protein
MTQDQWIILLLKVGCISGFLSLTGWVVQYHYYTRGAWRRNAIGRTLVAKTSLIAALLVPTTLSLFLDFNRLTSHIAGWIDTALIGLISPIMLWRILVWRKIHRQETGETGADAPGVNP